MSDVREEKGSYSGNAYLSRDGFFCAKQFIEATFLDLLQERSSNVHVRINSRLPSSEFRELSDSSLEMCCIRRKVPVLSSIPLSNNPLDTHDSQLRNIVNITDTRAPRNLSSIRLVLRQFRINFFCYLGEGICSVTRPEKVLRVEIVGLFRLFGRCYCDAVELELEAVGDECLVCPAVGQDGDEVDVAVENKEDYHDVSLGKAVKCVRQRTWSLEI